MAVEANGNGSSKKKKKKPIKRKRPISSPRTSQAARDEQGQPALGGKSAKRKKKAPKPAWYAPIAMRAFSQEEPGDERLRQYRAARIGQGASRPVVPPDFAEPKASWWRTVIGGELARAQKEAKAIRAGAFAEKGALAPVWAEGVERVIAGPERGRFAPFLFPGSPLGVDWLARATSAAFKEAGALPLVGSLVRGLHSGGHVILQAAETAAIALEAGAGAVNAHLHYDLPDAELQVLAEGRQVDPSDPLAAMKSRPDPLAAMILKWRQQPGYDAATWEGYQITFSGGKAVARALDRMMLGEEPEVTRYGNPDARGPLQVALLTRGLAPTQDGEWLIGPGDLEVFEDAISATDEMRLYWDWALANGADPLAVANELVTRGVPGESEPMLELVGRLVFDPLNVIGAGAKGRELREVKRAMAYLGKLDAAAPDEILTAMTHTRPGLLRMIDQLPDARRNDVYRDIVSVGGLFGGTARQQVRSVDDQARLWQGLVQSVSDNADEATLGLQAMTDLGFSRIVADEGMATAWGVQPGDIISPVESKGAKRAGVFLREWIADLTPEGEAVDFARLGSIFTEAENPTAAVKKLIDSVADTSARLWPDVNWGPAQPLITFNNSVRSFTAKFLHMGYSLPYANRNVSANTVIAAIDNVNPLHRTSWIDDVFKGLAMEPPEPGMGGAVSEVLEAQLKVPSGEKAVGLIEQAKETLRGGELIEKTKETLAAGPAIVLSGAVERRMGRSVIAHVANRVANRTWRVGKAIPADEVSDIVQALGWLEDSAEARQFIGILEGARNPTAAQAVVDTLMVQEGATYVRKTDAFLPSGLMGRLREMAADQDIMQAIKSADTPKDAIAMIDDLIARAMTAGDGVMSEAISKTDIHALDDLRLDAEMWARFPASRISPETARQGQAARAWNNRRIAASQAETRYWVNQAASNAISRGDPQGAALLDEAMQVDLAYRGEANSVREAVSQVREEAVAAAARGDYGPMQEFYAFREEQWGGFYRWTEDLFGGLSQRATAYVEGIPLTDRLDDIQDYYAAAEQGARVMPDGSIVVSTDPADIVRQTLGIGEQPTPAQWGQVEREAGQLQRSIMAALDDPEHAVALAHNVAVDGLVQAGYTADELAGLAPRQLERLVAETATGQLALTQKGRPRSIGGLSAARRQEVLRGLSPVQQDWVRFVEQNGGSTWAAIWDDVMRRARGRQAGQAVQASVPAYPGLRTAGTMTAGDPNPAHLSDLRAVEFKDLARQAQAHIRGQDWDATVGQVDSDAIAKLQVFIDDVFIPRQDVMRSVAARAGRETRDFAFHNYGDKRLFDVAAGFLWQYPYWYSRTYRKFAVRMVDQPALLSGYAKYRSTMEQINADQPEYMRTNIRLPFDLGGQETWMPLESWVNQLYGLTDSFKVPEQRRLEVAGLPVGKVLAGSDDWDIPGLGQWQGLGQYGMSLNVMVSGLAALAAYMQGDDRGANAWMNWQSSWTKAMVPTTAWAREKIPILEGIIPPGGIAPEMILPWMHGEDARLTGSIWDANRVGYYLTQMYLDGEVDERQSILAAYHQTGDVMDTARQQHALGRAFPTYQAMLLGTAFKPKADWEIYVGEMWEASSSLWKAKQDATVSPDEYAEAWATFRTRYPEYGIIKMCRGDEADRQESLVWWGLNNLPPGYERRELLNSYALDNLLEKFYDVKGDLSQFTPANRQRLVAAMLDIVTNMEQPTEDMVAEWAEVKKLRSEMTIAARALFGEDILDVEGAYYSILEEQGPEAARAFKDEFPQLGEYQQWRGDYYEADPLLKEYYISRESALQNTAWDTYSSVPPGYRKDDYIDALPWEYRNFFKLWAAGSGGEMFRSPSEFEAYVSATQAVADQMFPEEVTEEMREEWARVKGINSVYFDTRDQLFPLVGQGQYWDMSKEERRAYGAWKDEWAAEYPRWAYYYIRPDDEADTGAAGGRATRAGGGRQARRGGGGGWGRGRGGGAGPAGATTSWGGLMDEMGDLRNIAVASLSTYFADGRALPATLRAKLKAAYNQSKMGYSTFEAWLDEYVWGLWGAFLRQTGFPPMKAEQAFGGPRGSGGYYRPRGSRVSRARG
jgi:hypothetical protein